MNFLAAKDYRNASKWMGITTHYVDDLGVFGHVMGAKTDWDVEIHHDDYEGWVNTKTNSYNASFRFCLSFDGNLEQTSAYDAALKLAHDTTFDDSGKGHTAKWMDTNYNPSDPTFIARVCESLNGAVNILADLIYGAETTTNVPEFKDPLVLPAVLAIIAFSLWLNRQIRLDPKIHPSRIRAI